MDDLCLGDACHQLTNAEGRPNTEHLKETLDPTTAAPTVVDAMDFEDELSRVETLRVYRGDEAITRDVDLESVYISASDEYSRFEISDFSSEFGQIALPS